MNLPAELKEYCLHWDSFFLLKDNLFASISGVSLQCSSFTKRKWKKEEKNFTMPRNSLKHISWNLNNIFVTSTSIIAILFYLIEHTDKPMSMKFSSSAVSHWLIRRDVSARVKSRIWSNLLVAFFAYLLKLLHVSSDCNFLVHTLCEFKWEYDGDDLKIIRKCQKSNTSLT